MELNKKKDNICKCNFAIDLTLFNIACQREKLTNILKD